MKRFGSLSSVGVVAMALGLIAWSAADARYEHMKNVVNDATGPVLTARLVDKIKNSAKNAATVEVTVRGVRLVDTPFASQAPGPIEGHLHFQLDGGAIIATSTPKLSFHELPSGEHKISVNLTDGNHIPIGMPVDLTVTIPTVKTVMVY